MPRVTPLACALLLGLCATAARAEPPPAPSVDHRVVLARPSGPPVEIRRRGPLWRHEILGVRPPAVLVYDSASGMATIRNGGTTARLPLAPGEIGGFDAAATFAGLADGTPTWRRGAAREIAGAPCTDHHGDAARDGAPLTGTFCVTDTGIVLAIRIGGPGQVGRAYEAQAVEVGPQPADLFAVSPPDTSR